jgi:hypothetical protein
MKKQAQSVLGDNMIGNLTDRLLSFVFFTLDIR